MIFKSARSVSAAGFAAGLLALGLTHPPLQAQEKKAAIDTARGQQVVQSACASCHGADGNSVINANPKLAGQHPEYLYKQLMDFTKADDAKDARVNAIMKGFSLALTDADKRNVAAWLATQTPKLGTVRNKVSLDLGQRIYRAGIPEKSVPACAGCHAPNGVGIPAQYPRLSGQHAEYTEAALKSFREGSRRNNLSMSQIAGRLNDKEIAAVADYVAGLR